MQNLTAHYNILFNANELLRLKQEAYAAAYIDSYNELLSVYPDTAAQTTPPDKDLELAITKAQTIINVKEQSKYLGDAYLVMGKARYLEGNYFDAVEYFDYVIRSYGNNLPLKQEALCWKARALLYLGNLPPAKVAIDTAILSIIPKKKTPDGIYPAKLQYDINTQNYTDAEEDARLAIQYARTTEHKLRWTFILAQLQELNQKPGDAVDNYTRIVKSNAVFEMAFNANLNRIRIQDNHNGVKLSKTDRLRSLLKNQNNDDFQDQIYYQIAQQLYAGGDVDNAIKNYKLSVHASLKNQNQKGLSYLRMADIEFKDKADYTSAKLYYDSTLTYLSPTYPGYQIIRKKSNNLQLLTSLLQTITREDTLQMLASLDEKTRNERIDAMVTRKTLQEKQAAQVTAVNNNNQSNANDILADKGSRLRRGQNNQSSGNIFYFYNTAALSQGVNDFKRQWGNRKLEDNWRRSKRSNGTIAAGNTTAAGATPQNADPDAPTGQISNTATGINPANYRASLLKDLPLTPDLLQQSNLRIYNAITDLANFYRDILGDKKEAATTYELLLTRFPDNPDRAAIYYNLYRLYVDDNTAKSNTYKEKILKEFPESVYAKIIIDPEYAKKLDDVNAEFNGYYNGVYELYSQKKFTQVITRADELLTKYPNNEFAAQLYYLKTIAAGHQEKLPPFMTDLQQLIAKYPDDKLVTPLAAQHLAYIETNKAEVAARPVVLSGDDINEIPFTPPVAYQKQTEYRRVYKPSYEATVPQVRLPEKAKEPEITKAAPPAVKPAIPPPIDSVKKPAEDLPVVAKNNNTDSVSQPEKVAVVSPPLVSYIFNTRDSSNYYFAINVSSGTTNLSSSRFGIGQFNRTRFTGIPIKHDLLPVGADDQVIFVGRFYSLDEVKKYARLIIPLLPQIMKVPKDKYSFFIITKENLDKLANQKTLDSYIEYYQKYY